MTDNIKPFLKATTPDNADAIAMLEQWLEDAKAGEIVTVGLVGKRVGGGWQTGFSSFENGSDNIKPFIKATTPDNSECILILEQWLEDAKNGELISVGLIGKRIGGEWQTGFSSSENGLEDAAMLIELDMRRLGFKQR